MRLPAIWLTRLLRSARVACSQTGVPFGCVPIVRDEIRVEGRIGRPHKEHPARRVLGWSCPRVEVSGQRLWRWLLDRHGGVDGLARAAHVHSYCPLAFLDGSGRNVTPDKLRPAERERLHAVCDATLRDVVRLLCPIVLICVGKYAHGAQSGRGGRGGGRGRGRAVGATSNRRLSAQRALSRPWKPGQCTAGTQSLWPVSAGSGVSLEGRPIGRSTWLW